MVRQVAPDVDDISRGDGTVAVFSQTDPAEAVPCASRHFSSCVTLEQESETSYWQRGLLRMCARGTCIFVLPGFFGRLLPQWTYFLLRWMQARWKLQRRN